MKQKFVCILLMFLTVFFFALPAAAQTQEENPTYEEITERMDSELEENLNHETADFLDEHDISMENPQGITDTGIKDYLLHFLELLREEITKPLTLLGKLIAVALICALAKSMVPEGSSVTKTFELVGVLTAVTLMYDEIVRSMEYALTALSEMQTFMLAYIPVFSSVAATSASPAAAGSYYVLIFTVCELLGYLTSALVLPFLGLLTAFAIVQPMSGLFSYGGFVEGVKKIVVWVLGIGMTIFTGLLTIQSVIGSSADSVGIRTAKFAASSFIPVVGSSVSDAYTTVRASLGVIRAGVGGIGIIALLVMVLRPVAVILCVKFAVFLASVISGMLGEKQLNGLLQSLNAVLTILLSAVVCFGLVFIVSTAVILMLSMGIT